MERIAVMVKAQDPISEGGVVGALRPRPEVQLVGSAEQARVVIVVADVVDDAALQVVRSVRRQADVRVVMVSGRLDDDAVADSVEAGVLGMVRRGEATPERLVAVVRGAASGEGAVPADLLGRLLSEVGSLQRQVLRPRGLTLTGLAAREIEVLRLVADGLDTAEIAQYLAYSERTVKNVLHDITSRFQLRNRAHAVAYALREGLI